MSHHRPPKKKTPPHPTRNFKNYLKFLGIAFMLVFLLEYFVFQGERPHITKLKQEYAAAQQAEQDALEALLPPKIVFPESGEEYFQTPEIMAPEIVTSDEQSLLPEKELNIAPIIEAEEEQAIAAITPPKKQITKAPPATSTKAPTTGRPKIAIVIDDVGMNISQSRAAIDLPSTVTLAMLPYARDVRVMADQARAEGHELLIHTPMEAMSSDVDLGALALHSNMSDSDFQSEFDKMTASFEGYSGINNHMGSKLTQDTAAMRRVMGELKKRGLYFLDSRTIGASVAIDEAQQAGIGHATRDVFLDHEDTPQFLAEALRKTEKIARDSGSAIAIGHPKQVTMSALRAWIPTLEQRGFELVQLSDLVVGQQAQPQSPAKIEPASGESSVMPLTAEEERIVLPLATPNKIEIYRE